MKNLIILLSLLLLTITVEAQQIGTSIYNQYFQTINTQSTPEVEGSPFLVSNWTDGSITTKNGEIFDDLKLIYNVVDNELLYKRKDGKIYKLADSAISSFNLFLPQKNYTFVKSDELTDGYKGKAYLENIANGKFTLYKKHNISIIDSRGYGAQNLKILLNPTTSLYIQRNGIFSKINFNKNSIAALIPEKKEEIKTYIRNEKIDIDKEMDLKKLFVFINHF